MINDIQALLAATYKFYCGEKPNEWEAARPRQQVQTELRDALKTVMLDLRMQGRVYNYQVIVDETVNMPKTLERGYINAQVVWALTITPELRVFSAGDPEWVHAVTRQMEMPA